MLKLNVALIARQTLDISGRDVASLAEACWQILDPKGTQTKPFLFLYGGRLVRLVPSGEASSSCFEPLTSDRLAHELSKRIRFVDSLQARRAGEYVPSELLKHMLADPNPPVHRVEAFTRVPLFDCSGTLIQKEGYHSDYRIFYRPDASIRSSFDLSAVTQEDVRKAKALILDELLKDFPFVNEADRANAVSLLLLPFVRHLIPGHVPLYLIDKPRAGEGATLLASTLLTPAFGDAIPRTPPPNDEGEWRRTILSILSGGPNCVLLDNLTTLRSSYLASSITSEALIDRLVGAGSALMVPVRCIWVGTAINAELSEEIRRRTVLISLDSGVENPSERNSFRIPHLKEWAMDKRNRLIHAALTIVQGWMNAGYQFSEKTFGGFERYAQFMGGILEYAEIPGFLEASHGRTPAGSVTEWLKGFAFTSEMYSQFVDESVPAKSLVNVARQTRFISPTDNVLVLARKLSQIQDKTFGRFILRKAKVLHNTVLWKLENTGFWESRD